MKQLPAILFLLSTLALPSGCSRPDVLGARQAAETYARVEFEGGDPEERWKIIKFSPERMAVLQRDPKAMPYVEFSDHEPQYIVSGYQVKDVRVEGDRATAVVVYQRLARTKEHHNSPYFSDKNDNDLVTLNLVFDRGWRPPTWSVSYATAIWNFFFTKDQWWVLDPPASRVSKQVLLAYYEWQVKEYSSMWEQELNDPSYSAKQKANVRASRDKATGNLRLLKSLP